MPLAGGPVAALGAPGPCARGGPEGAADARGPWAGVEECSASADASPTRTAGRDSGPGAGPDSRVPAPSQPAAGAERGFRAHDTPGPRADLRDEDEAESSLLPPGEEAGAPTPPVHAAACFAAAASTSSLRTTDSRSPFCSSYTQRTGLPLTRASTWAWLPSWIMCRWRAASATVLPFGSEMTCPCWVATYTQCSTRASRTEATSLAVRGRAAASAGVPACAVPRAPASPAELPCGASKGDAAPGDSGLEAEGAGAGLGPSADVSRAHSCVAWSHAAWTPCSMAELSAPSGAAPAPSLPALASPCGRPGEGEEAAAPHRGGVDVAPPASALACAPAVCRMGGGADARRGDTRDGGGGVGDPAWAASGPVGGGGTCAPRNAASLPRPLSASGARGGGAGPGPAGERARPLMPDGPDGPDGRPGPPRPALESAERAGASDSARARAGRAGAERALRLPLRLYTQCAAGPYSALWCMASERTCTSALSVPQSTVVCRLR
mmetsp:Transcript_22425/g.60644  ORF Transcript_22425/g.60644 Transcript_22425/m.60644 type:complete len:496 (-) Transcript_22425:2077-3564(-)